MSFHDVLTSNQSRKLAVLCVILAVAVLAGFTLLLSHLLSNTKSPPMNKGESNSSERGSLPINEGIVPLEKKIKMVKHTLVRDDTLYDVLRGNGITPGEIADLLTTSKKIYNLSRIRSGNVLELEIDTPDNTINSLRYEIDEENILVVERSDDGFSARKERVEYETRISVKGSAVRNSLFEAVIDVGLHPQMALDLADIFAWDIDFNVDIREGDGFRILFEQKYKDGDFVRNGRILGAQFINQGKAFWAVLFKDEDGRIDYYDLQGKSLRKQFLKSPLRYRYISSRYSRRRFHPILKIFRPHLGIDYAAPIGTPVVAVSDGKILFVGRNGGYGKIIKIRHNSIYTTTYGHLSRFAREMRRNRQVTQGQVIGYVGSTGLSTGPHLDYRLMNNGRYINPLTCNFLSADPVKKRYLKDFELVKKEVFSKLEQLDITPIDKHFAEGGSSR
ncbi:MAG: peptidoglycan DD-metalloendopeptidase family protein [Pseudomonadota bacterium]